MIPHPFPFLNIQQHVPDIPHQLSMKECSWQYNHHGTLISVIWLVEGTAIYFLILHVNKEEQTPNFNANTFNASRT